MIDHLKLFLIQCQFETFTLDSIPLRWWKFRIHFDSKPSRGFVKCRDAFSINPLTGLCVTAISHPSCPFTDTKLRCQFTVCHNKFHWLQLLSHEIRFGIVASKWRKFLIFGRQRRGERPRFRIKSRATLNDIFNLLFTTSHQQIANQAFYGSCLRIN